ncbi:N-acetyltransferase [Paenibacillus sp. CN-4]|uniref:N-acetyltransferase n=1 Tax=Paenibacillus nanchangensis TaxID=3348343 RepID=UPI003979D162
MVDVYEECPSYQKTRVSFKQTHEEDAADLLLCYSDLKAVPLFNSDNCNGDNFHYDTIEKMKKTISFWNDSYILKCFVRWTLTTNETDEKMGTVEMFHRTADDEFDHYGLLRIDLRSKYEAQPVINEILDIVEENFFELFNVDAILTKSIAHASERITSLLQKGYRPLNQKFVVYDDYYVKYKLS